MARKQNNHDSLLHTQKSYAIYLRKSRADIEAEKVEKYDTLSKHYSILMDLAVKDGYNVTAIYREIVSGDTIKARPEMQKLLAEVKKGTYAGVLVTEVSRLGRGNSTDQGIISEAFQKSGTQIITPRKIYNTLQDADQDFFDFELFMARQEYKYIRRRLIAGRRQAASTGQFVFSLAPYGFDKRTIDKKKTLVQNDKIKYVKMLFDFFNSGKSWHECCKYMYAIGAKPTKSELWNVHSIQSIINNPAYIGKMRIKTNEGQELIDGIWDPVISEDIFYKRKNIDIPHTKGALRLRSKYAGLLRCSICGKALTLNDGYYYHKNTAYPRCYVVSVTDTLLDECVIRELKNTISNFEVQLKNESKTEKTDFTSAINDLNKQLKSIYDKYEKGIYDDEEFIERRKVIRDNIAELHQLQEEESKIKDYSEIKKSIYFLIDCISNNQIPPDKINEFLKGFITKIEYTRADGKSEPSIKIHFME